MEQSSNFFDTVNPRPPREEGWPYLPLWPGYKLEPTLPWEVPSTGSPHNSSNMSPASIPACLCVCVCVYVGGVVWGEVDSSYNLRPLLLSYTLTGATATSWIHPHNPIGTDLVCQAVFLHLHNQCHVIHVPAGQIALHQTSH